MQEVLEGTEVVGLFRSLSAVHHSCHPNCEVIMRSEPDARFAARAVLHVIRTEIAPGEELTISYIDGDGTREDRHAALQPYAFTCDECHTRTLSSLLNKERVGTLRGLLCRSCPGIDWTCTNIHMGQAFMKRSQWRETYLL